MAISRLSIDKNSYWGKTQWEKPRQKTVWSPVPHCNLYRTEKMSAGEKKRKKYQPMRKIISQGRKYWQLSEVLANTVFSISFLRHCALTTFKREFTQCRVTYTHLIYSYQLSTSRARIIVSIKSRRKTSKTIRKWRCNGDIYCSGVHKCQLYVYDIESS